MISLDKVTEKLGITVVTKNVKKSPLQYSSITPNQPKHGLVFSGAS